MWSLVKEKLQILSMKHVLSSKWREIYRTSASKAAWWTWCTELLSRPLSISALIPCCLLSQYCVSPTVSVLHFQQVLHLWCQRSDLWLQLPALLLNTCCHNHCWHSTTVNHNRLCCCYCKFLLLFCPSMLLLLFFCCSSSQEGDPKNIFTSINTYPKMFTMMFIISMEKLFLFLSNMFICVTSATCSQSLEEGLWLWPLPVSNSRYYSI